MISKQIAQLIEYSVIHLGLDELDRTYCTNLLMELLKCDNFYEGDVDISYIKRLSVPDEIIDSIANYAISVGIADASSVVNFTTRIMGVVTPLPSAVKSKFNQLASQDIKKATDYLYKLSVASNYIQQTAVAKNIWWKAEFETGAIEITINLSKPEKDNKDIAKLLSKNVEVNYPKCMLCSENVGFGGTSTKPARHNLRTVDVELAREKWFMQYSPYVYYEEHCIVINYNHCPMDINKQTFVKLADFVDIFPHYFVGSNASLPIVGGSILNHEHFQGGKHLMPLQLAKVRTKLVSKQFSEVEIGVVDWYNSVLRFTSANREALINCAQYVLATYDDYTDENVGLIAFTTAKHNTVTPVMRKEKGKYIAEIIFRNNRTNEEHKDGIFHAHSEYHNIKKEGIGLIEAMGLFILPARLQRQMQVIEDVLIGRQVEWTQDMEVHQSMKQELVNKYGTNNTQAVASTIVKGYINDTCRNILLNTAVFSTVESFVKFTNKCGFLEVE